MSAKKVAIGARPTTKPAPGPVAMDEWVSSRSGPDGPEPMKRLTIDIPESLHRAIKAQCALRGAKIVDEVRELLIQKYGNP